MIGAELGGAVHTEGGHQQVAVVIVVGGPAEQTDELGHALVGGHAGGTVLEAVTLFEGVPKVAVIREVPVGGAEVLAVAVLVGVTGDRGHVVVAEIAHIIGAEFEHVGGVVGGIAAGLAVARALGRALVLTGVVVAADGALALADIHQLEGERVDGLELRGTVEADVAVAVHAQLLVDDGHRVRIQVDVPQLIVAVLVVDGLERSLDAGLAVGVGRVEAGLPVHFVGHHLGGNLEHVIQEILGDHGPGADVAPAGVLDGTFVVVVGDVGGVETVRAAAADGQVVVLGDADLADLREPVGLGLVGELAVGALEAPALGPAGEDIVSGHEVRTLEPLGSGHIAGILDRGRHFALGVAGGDDDDAVGTAGTVNSGRGAILQHVDGLDVLRSDRGKGARDAVHEDERSGRAVQGGSTAEHHGGGSGRITGRDGDLQAGDLALDELAGVDDRALRELVGLHALHGGRDVGLFLGTVADGDGFLQEGHRLLEHDVDDGAVPDGLFDGLIADAGELENGGGAFDGNDVLAVSTGHDTVRRSHFHDAGSDDGLARFVGDGSPHRHGRHRRDGCQEQCQGQTELMESFHTVGLRVGLRVNYDD